MKAPDPNDTENRPAVRPVVLVPVSGPPAPDMNKVREQGLKKHETDLRNAEVLTAQARSGTAPAASTETPAPKPTVAKGSYVVTFDWRGETATYREHDRSATVASIYWGGPKGSVSHQHGVWEYPDGRRVAMASEERRMVLERVAERARSGHGIVLEVSGE